MRHTINIKKCQTGAVTQKSTTQNECKLLSKVHIWMQNNQNKKQNGTQKGHRETQNGYKTQNDHERKRLQRCKMTSRRKTDRDTKLTQSQVVFDICLLEGLRGWFTCLCPEAAVSQSVHDDDTTIQHFLLYCLCVKQKDLKHVNMLPCSGLQLHMTESEASVRQQWYRTYSWSFSETLRPPPLLLTFALITYLTPVSSSGPSPGIHPQTDWQHIVCWALLRDGELTALHVRTVFFRERLLLKRREEKNNPPHLFFERLGRVESILANMQPDWSWIADS